MWPVIPGRVAVSVSAVEVGLNEFSAQKRAMTLVVATANQESISRISQSIATQNTTPF